MKRVISICVVMLWCLTTDGQHGMVKWMGIEEAMTAYRQQPKPILLDFYTDWCGWCKKMMATTYSDQGIAQYINTYFYPVKFNAEGKDTIDFLGTTYVNPSQAAKSTHEFAIKMLQGKTMYPSTVFLNALDTTRNEFRLNMLAAGYLDQQKIQPMLIFTLENVFRNTGFESFKAQYQKAFMDSASSVAAEFLPADSISKTEGKKSVVFITTDWCNACKVMERTSFDDSLTADYIADKFNLFSLHPDSKDTIEYKGQTYAGSASSLHPLAMTLCRNSFVLPSTVILDESDNIIDVIPSYLPPELLSKILHYYGDDAYKEKSWQEYVGGS